MQVNIHAAKTNLSKLIDRAHSGEDIIIAKAGKPVAKLTPIRAKRQRVFGSAAGQIIFHKGWDSPMSSKELKDFLGS